MKKEHEEGKRNGDMSETTGKKPAVKKKVRRKGKRRVSLRRRILTILAILMPAALIAGVILYFLVFRENAGKEITEVPGNDIQIQEKPDEEAPQKGIGSNIINHILTAESAVEESYQKRPKTVEITEENAADFATLESCLIDGSAGKVNVKVKGEGIPASDDKYYYLFALNTYDNTIPDDAEYLSRLYKDEGTEFSTPLNYNYSTSKLYKKFVVAVKKDGKYLAVTGPRYITNPEAIAKYGSVYQVPATKKGLLVDPNKLRGNELDDLGIKQAAYNIPVARLLGPSTHSAYPTIQYTYNGKTYTLNGQVIAEYDLVFSTLTAKGISTTAIILNNYSGSYPQLIHPKSRSYGAAPYYMFNGAEESGVDYMAAIGTFLAERYSGNSHGRISNWVIANEINARKEWNYMERVGTSEYVEEYAKAFRVFYTAIKSVSSSARVYMPIDQQWDRNLKNNTNYDGRDIVDEFNRNIKSSGNIDWGLSQHPYNVPLTEARIWKSNKLVTHSADTSMITMANIEVLTNYMAQDAYRTDDGEVRSIILSEQGYTSTAGEALQAAAIAYAYYRVENNPHIDGFLLNRETDASEEVAQGLAFGLNHANGSPKQSYNVYKYIDTPNHAQYTDFAKSIIGISSWSEIMR